MSNEEKRDLVSGLLEAECFRTGEFKLKSGQISPFYIDLRMIISAPSLLEKAASIFSSLLGPLDFVRIAGIPLAGVPLATAVSLLLGVPMVFPRVDRKDHGTGKMIEGAFQRGEHIVLLDDLITTGESKFEAIEILRDEGLVVEDLVVLIERGRNAREELQGQGVKLHAYLGIDDFLDMCLELGKIDESQRQIIDAFLAKG